MMRKISLAAVQLATLLAVSMAHATPPAEINIPGQKIFPESLTSRADGSILIGSIGAKTIYQVKPGAAEAQVWITPQLAEQHGIFGVFADTRSGTLWACSSGRAAPGAPPPAQAALHAFDPKTGRSKGEYPLPTPGAFCNDIAVGSDGTAYVSDTANMEVARLKKGAKALEVWAGPCRQIDSAAIHGQRLRLSRTE